MNVTRVNKGLYSSINIRTIQLDLLALCLGVQLPSYKPYLVHLNMLLNVLTACTADHYVGSIGHTQSDCSLSWSSFLICIHQYLPDKGMPTSSKPIQIIVHPCHKPLLAPSDVLQFGVENPSIKTTADIHSVTRQAIISLRAMLR